MEIFTSGKYYVGVRGNATQRLRISVMFKEEELRLGGVREGSRTI